MVLIKKQELIKSKHCSVFFFSIINWINAVLQQHNTLLKMTFQEQIQQGIPSVLPKQKPYETDINHAPKRKEILSSEEKKLALRNALRYFEPQHHAELIQEFSEELETYGRIYMYRLILIMKCVRVQLMTIPENLNRQKPLCS